MFRILEGRSECITLGAVTHQEFLYMHFPAFLFTMSLIVVCVVLHYEVMVWLSEALERLKSLRRMRMVLVILGAMGTHLTEIWIFAVGFYLLDQIHPGEVLQGNISGGLLDIVYFSGVTFTTIGYGDVVPIGPARFMAAMEALTGLVLIAWSASFTYVEMGRFWAKR